ncbi:MAG: SRPBCC family protein [Acidimicrobiia bacterium]
MADASTEIAVDASPDATWAVVGDFHGLGDWMPGIDEAVAEGDDRVLSMMGMTIRERMTARDDAARSISYTIVEGAPVESHLATLTVSSAGDGSKVVWDVTVTPDEMAPVFAGIYEQALVPLKAKVEQG